MNCINPGEKNNTPQTPNTNTNHQPQKGNFCDPPSGTVPNSAPDGGGDKLPPLARYGITVFFPPSARRRARFAAPSADPASWGRRRGEGCCCSLTKNKFSGTELTSLDKGATPQMCIVPRGIAGGWICGHDVGVTGDSGLYSVSRGNPAASSFSLLGDFFFP